MTQTDLFPSEQQSRDKQQEIAAAKEAIAGPIPLVPEAPDLGFTLPRGLFHTGVWHREGFVRELTGADEEQLAKAKDVLGYFNAVLASGVASIGTIDLQSHTFLERVGLLNELLIGEREILFLKVVHASFGDTKMLPITCTSCETKQEIELHLSEDFKPTEVTNIEQAVFEFVTSKGDRLEFRPAVGADQEEVIGKKGASPAEQNTLMLSRCLVKRNGEMILDPQGYARGMSIKDRQALLQALVDRQPMIDLNVEIKCSVCGGDLSFALGWGDFFRP